MNTASAVVALPVALFCSLLAAQTDDERVAPMTHAVVRSAVAAEEARTAAESIKVDWTNIKDSSRSSPELQKRSRSTAISLPLMTPGGAERVQALIETADRANGKIQQTVKLALDANDAANEASSSTEAIAQFVMQNYSGAAAREQMMRPGIDRSLRSRDAEKLLELTKQKRTAVLRNARALSDEMRRAQLTHRKLLADYQAADKQGKADMSLALEADSAAQKTASFGAQAASAYAQAAQLAATELRLARVIVELQTLIAQETISNAEVLVKKP